MSRNNNYNKLEIKIELLWNAGIKMKKKSILNTIFKGTIFYNIYLKSLKEPLEVIRWRINGRPVPPPHLIKEQNIKKYAKQFHLHTFVETGTYYGDMVQAVKNSFNKIYSIELSDKLYSLCVNRFKSDKKICLIQGDSAIKLRNVLEEINCPALFWLDGHYSSGVTVKSENETPILDELSLIFEYPNHGHVIVIDDARNFGTNPAYPSISELTKFILNKRSDVEIKILFDSICVFPNNYKFE